MLSVSKHKKYIKLNTAENIFKTISLRIPMRIYTVYISSICFKSSNISFQEMVKKNLCVKFLFLWVLQTSALFFLQVTTELHRQTSHTQHSSEEGVEVFTQHDVCTITALTSSQPRPVITQQLQ